MTDEQVWTIITAPPTVSARQLADDLGLTYSAVHSRRWDLRKHGWSCKIDWTPCEVCQKPLIEAGRQPRRYHPDCRPIALKGLYAAYWQERKPRLTDRQRDYRAEVRDEYYAQAQEETRAKATNHGQPFTPEEDELILAMSATHTRKEIAIATGRTLHAIKRRLGYLRSREVEG